MKSKKNQGLRSLISLLAFIVVLLSGCSNRPSNVLDEDEMVRLMVDMEIVEAYTSQNAVSPDERIYLGRRVLAKHGVSEETLDTTLAWYGRNIDEYASLFEKIDKELNKRKIKYSDNPNEENIKGDNLWPYSSHQIISPLAAKDALTFSINNPSIAKGNLINLSFITAGPTSGKGFIGVEYTDGSGESNTNSFSNKARMEVALQSDTAKTIKRLYGVMQFRDIKNMPIFVDSISLSVAPIDSATYSQKKRNQKSYGALYNRKPAKKLERDTISHEKSDSLTKADSLKMEKPDAKETEKDMPTDNRANNVNNSSRENKENRIEKKR